MKKYLVVGASSGIGRALTKKLVDEGSMIWAVARREEFLESLKNEVRLPKNYFYSVADISRKNTWFNLIKTLKRRKYIPEIVVMCAAILKNDLNDKIDLRITHELFDINYFSVMEGINFLVPFLKRNSQIITISSLSSQKGSGAEGIGYAASKAALSLSFESLHQRFKNKLKFKVVFFGPVETGMHPFGKQTLITISEKRAVRTIINAIEGKRVFYYCPKLPFFVLKLTKLFSQSLYFRVLDAIDSLHIKNQKNNLC